MHAIDWVKYDYIPNMYFMNKNLHRRYNVFDDVFENCKKRRLPSQMSLILNTRHLICSKLSYFSILDKN